MLPMQDSHTISHIDFTFLFFCVCFLGGAYSARKLLTGLLDQGPARQWCMGISFTVAAPPWWQPGGSLAVLGHLLFLEHFFSIVNFR